MQKAKQVYCQINQTITGKKESKNNSKIRAVGKGKAKDKMGRAYAEGDKEKGRPCRR
jgi:hypothetical protein